MSKLTVWTVGHSNVDAEVLLKALRAADIELLVDIRRFPQSRRNPQFNRDRLAQLLREAGIEYRHMESLGGRRIPDERSANRGLRDEGFRGYADYMATPEFEAALMELIEAADTRRTAIMCAEALPWRCHRSLVADTLVARGVRVLDLVGGKEHEHALSPSARVEDGRVTYPAML